MILDDDLTLDHVDMNHLSSAIRRRRAQKSTASGLTFIEARDGSLGVFDNRTAKHLGTLTRYDRPTVTPPPRIGPVLWLTCFLAWVAVATVVVLVVRFFFA